jgi:hypothetical protein
VLYIGSTGDQMKRAASGFEKKEKQILINVAQKIGATLGQVAALGEVAKKASQAKPKRMRRRRQGAVRKKTASKARRRVRRVRRNKNLHPARRR